MADRRPLEREAPGTTAPATDEPDGPRVCTPLPGPKSVEALATIDAIECPAFEQRRQHRQAQSGQSMPRVVLARGRGAWLWDVDDNCFADFVANFGAALLGHAHPAVQDAASTQASQLHAGLGDVLASDVKARLMSRLSAWPGGPWRVLLTQSGGDAVTAAIKTATLATGRPGLLAFDGSYHGLGYAPLAACGLRESYRAPFAEQLNRHTRWVPYPGRADDLDACLAGADEQLARGDIGAVLVEPLLGRGGCVVPPDGFLPELVRVAHARGALVIADEIWTGVGRTGSWLATEPLIGDIDIVCLGKGLGGGFPISACLARDAVMGAWARGGEVLHTSTHAGWPVACAVALAVLDELERMQPIGRVGDVGARLMSGLREAVGDRGHVRGRGAMIGVDFGSSSRCTAVLSGLLHRGYLALSGGTAGDVMTLTPPYVVSDALLDGFCDAVAEIAHEMEPRHGG